MKLTEEEKTILVAVSKVASSSGTALKEVSEETGYTVQKLTAVLKKVDNIRFAKVRFCYTPSYSFSFRSALPGIKNGKNGISGYTPAEVSVHFTK